MVLLVLDEVEDEDGLGEDLGGDRLLTDSFELRMFLISMLSEELEVLERLRECIFSWTLTLTVDFFSGGRLSSLPERLLLWEEDVVIRSRRAGRRSL